MGLLSKQHPLKFDFDGYTVEAVIYYSAKDYRIEVQKPIQVTLPGKHIMLMLPAVYVVKIVSESGHGQIPLESRCIKEIQEYFSKPKNAPNS